MKEGCSCSHKSLFYKMQEPTNTHKLIILYMLHRGGGLLKRVQLFDFILKREYADYFTLQKAIAELIETELVREKQEEDGVGLVITDEGDMTLTYFGDRLSDAIKSDADLFFKEEEANNNGGTFPRTRCYKNSAREYVAELAVRDMKSELMKVSVTFANEADARRASSNFIIKNMDIYDYLIKQLTDEGNGENNGSV